ncbi:MAG: heavy metal-responsive transcriptional regulator [Chloroflexi bacterium]|nr:heavy metal-responsive transcriptional regulator [Chloroflexota bacterium]
MKIGELAKAVGFNPASIRYYETIGLLRHSDRTLSNYRVYDESHVERLRFIKKAKRLGFSLVDIKGILLLYDQDKPTCMHVRSLLEGNIKDAEAKLQGIVEFRDELIRLLAFAGDVEDCRPSGGRICSIIEESELNLCNQRELAH